MRTHCPYLGLKEDKATVLFYPSAENWCHSSGEPQAIGEEEQREFCLSGKHERCSRFPSPAVQISPQQAVSGDAYPEAGRLSERGLKRGMSRVPQVGQMVRPLVAYIADITQGVPLYEILIWMGFGIFAVAFLYWLLKPASMPTARPIETAAPAFIRSPTPTLAPTSTVAPTPTPSAAIATPVPSVPTPPPGGAVFSLAPAANAVGWVVSLKPEPQFGDRNMHTGIFKDDIYHGVMRFDLSSIPPGSSIHFAAVELTGLSGANLGSDGSWQLRMLDSSVDADWLSHTYEDIHNAAIDATIPPTLFNTDLGANRVNTFIFTADQLAALEERLANGVISFRLDGPSSGGDNLFTWDSGYGEGFGTKPILRIVAVPPPTPTLIVVTSTATAASVFEAATRVALATFQATTVGTPTPVPPNWVTATPFVVVTDTPTPANAATATYISARATAIAFTTGTPTPCTNCATATPMPTPTSTPVLIYLDQLTPMPTPTPTVTPTPTPTAIPDVLKGKIAFLSDRFGAPAVFVMDPDGNRVAKLTNPWAYEAALKLEPFSPDGSQRALVRCYGGNCQIWVQNIADGWTWYLTGRTEGADYEPAWSPDSAHIAYVSQRDGNDEIYVVDKDAATDKRLTQNLWEWDKHPTWSPGGDRIAFWSNRTGRKQIWIMNADGSQQRNISDNEYNDWGPVWIK